MLRYDALVEALADAFRADIAVPDKIAHFIPQPSGSEAKILMMAAWTTTGERFIGHKLVNVFPDNAKKNKPAPRHRSRGCKQLREVTWRVEAFRPQPPFQERPT